ncbi:hypothetical protein LP109_06415 [Moraxella bovis]|uniref:hypothetical protein n=1 Tax=Moraxella bovis TaxID=476 RepID=UPI00099392CD|nr:hypothetical protein [Moraxella bovis]OOR88189.1 hypothetical protein B0182_10440 [Moraxella bovis]UZA17880.1 hypothetical protein LP109_06305 [Moraxella bovis]UZA17891.1 hypothetical protein LP109_06360 [Moraxella bovis]UZA17902.1 hypothetical protein LP109_06415 [Moraxella bovis]
MKVMFNTATILPTMSKSTKEVEGKTVTNTYFNTTMFEPVRYSLRPANGVMPIEQIQAVLEQCADNADEVEIEYKLSQTKYGPVMEIYSVKPIKPKTTA